MPNPSPLAYRVHDALKGEYVDLSEHYILLRPDGVLVEFEHDGCEIWEFVPLTELLPSGAPRYIIKRGTGYKDSNGNEIFEGDKLRFNRPGEAPQFITPEYDNEDLKWYDVSGSFTRDIDPRKLHYFRIVGNIHDEEREEEKSE